MIVQLAGAAPSGDEIDTTNDPLRFDEAWAWFQQRVPVTREHWDQLDDQARRRAFTASNVATLDMLEQVWHGIDRAVDQGVSFADFQRDAIRTLGQDWADERPYRLETIFRTNVQQAYAAGRYQQMRDPDVMAERPYWEFVALLDSRTTQICRPLEGVVKHADDPWWRTHFPPLHYSCRSTTITLPEEEGALHHPAPDGADDPLQGFGGTPDLREWQPEARDYPPQLWHEFEQWQERRAPTPATPMTPDRAPVYSPAGPTVRSEVAIQLS